MTRGGAVREEVHGATVGGLPLGVFYREELQAASELGAEAQKPLHLAVISRDARAPLWRGSEREPGAGAGFLARAFGGGVGADARIRRR